MKELTFSSYLKNYVKELSTDNTLDITVLLSECKDNSNLKSALVLYCVLCDKMTTLNNILRRNPELAFPIGETNFTEKDLKAKKTTINPDYVEIYKNYLAMKKEGVVSHERKEDLRKQILRLNKKRNLSMRKLSVIAGVDSSNFNTFMKNKEYSKVSTERLEKVVEFLKEK